MFLIPACLLSFIFHFQSCCSVACTAVDVHHLGERLPDDFKFPLSEPLLKRFEYEFHSASYHLMNEVVMALRTVIGHLTKALHDVQNTEHEELKDQLVPEFMLNLYEHLKGHSEVLREVGVRSAQPSHLQCLADLPLMSAYDCLKLFFGWVEEGYYDFSALPFPFKVHMIYQDRLLMDQQLRLRWLGSISDLKEELQDLITVLKHSEQDITNRVKEAASVSHCWERGSCGNMEEIHSTQSGFSFIKEREITISGGQVFKNAQISKR